MNEERRAELRRTAEQVRARECDLGEMYDQLGAEDVLALLDAADRVAALEAENTTLRADVERYRRSLGIVGGPSKNLCDKFWADNAREMYNAAAEMAEEDRKDAADRIATLEAELAALRLEKE